MRADAKELHRKHQDNDEDTWALKVAGTPQSAIVNRLGENAAKLALVRAISFDPAKPSISTSDVAWGWAVAMHCARALLKDADRFIADTDYERKVNKALEIIRKNGPISSSQMISKGFKLPERERGEILRTLVEGGLVLQTTVTHAGPGRPTTRYAVAPGTTKDFSHG